MVTMHMCKHSHICGVHTHTQALTYRHKIKTNKSSKKGGLLQLVMRNTYTWKKRAGENKLREN